MDTDRPPPSHRAQRKRNRHPWYYKLFNRILSGLVLRPKTRRDVVEILRDAQQRQVLDYEAQSMLEGVLTVSDTRVREIMIPRAQMDVVERDSDTDALLQTLVQTGHSRFPVIGDSKDEVLGVLLAKDVLNHVVSYGKEKLDVREVSRAAVFVPESKRLNTLLWEFRASRNHIAIVVDEYGGVSGLVTIEDVIEQIVGEIDDEYDIDSSPNIVKHYGDRYSIKALTPLSEFNDCFETEFVAENVDTIGGFIMQRFSYVPRRGEKLVLNGNLRCKVLKADARRIHQLEFKIVESQQELDLSEPEFDDADIDDDAETGRAA